MFQRIMNRKGFFPQDGKPYVAVRKWALTFSPVVAAELRGFRKCDLLWDADKKLFGICPIKNDKMLGCFALNFYDDEVRVSGNKWIREELLPICDKLGNHIFLLQKRVDVPDYAGSAVYMADLSGKAL
jgi:hypothetical protein